MKQGGVAVLIRPEFEQNFAASTGERTRTSNDVDVEVLLSSMMLKCRLLPYLASERPLVTAAANAKWKFAFA